MRKSAILLLLLAPSLVFPQQGKGGKGKGGKGGPQHQFLGMPAAELVNVILARPTDRKITVSVMLQRDGAAYLTYAAAGGEMKETQKRTLKEGEPASFELSGLKPDAEYTYRVHWKPSADQAFKQEPERRFHTQRRKGEPFVFTLQADSHLDQASNGALYERTLANVEADRPDFHVDLGDTFMTDKYDDYVDALPQYRAQRLYLGLVGRAAPVFLVAGNHDGERGDRYDGTEDCMPVWACRQRQKYFPPPFPDGFYTGNRREQRPLGRLGNYYAWEWGDALFVALDPFWTSNAKGAGRGRSKSNWTRTLGDEQYHWLAKTLADSKARWKFLFIHHLVGGLDDQGRGGSEAAPLYEWGGKGQSGDDEFAKMRPGWNEPIHALLVKHHATAVFHGHDHFFAAQELDGVGYVMVPQPGHPGSDRIRNADEYGYIRGVFLPSSGHLRVSVSPEAATMEYVRAFRPSDETARRTNRQVAYRVQFD